MSRPGAVDATGAREQLAMAAAPATAVGVVMVAGCSIAADVAMDAMAADATAEMLATADATVVVMVATAACSIAADVAMVAMAADATAVMLATAAELATAVELATADATAVTVATAGCSIAADAATAAMAVDATAGAMAELATAAPAARLPLRLRSRLRLRSLSPLSHPRLAQRLLCPLRLLSL